MGILWEYYGNIMAILLNIIKYYYNRKKLNSYISAIPIIFEDFVVIQYTVS